MTTQQILENANRAKTELALLNKEQKDIALNALADALISSKDYILSQNALDVETAKSTLSPVMLDRLTLTDARVAAMADGIRALIALDDPVGKVIDQRTTMDGLKLKKVSVPLGVVAIIYESRPNVTSDAAALCLKSGNVCVLRGGKEAYRSSKAITDALRTGLKETGFNENFINIIDDVTRDSARELMTARGMVDLLIPRGGKGLISACVQNATVPVIETGTGICTVYVDSTYDINKALDIIENAKTQRPSVCNACETLLVNKSIAKDFLPMLKRRLADDRSAKGLAPVELRLFGEAYDENIGIKATEADFDTEFLDYVLAVKTVADVKEAVEHISLHSTHHSEAIVTEDAAAAEYFTRHVDSAAVYVNASTRFTDGGKFGLGCEMGISTQKLHARGPMGLEELTSYKYIITGNGTVRKS